MVGNVINEYKWSPEIIGDLFFDAEDYLGLWYWNAQVAQIVKEMKPPK
jgi:hypothetical protein